MIQVTNLTKSYTAKTLFEDISFNISKSEIVGLVGRNGAGKSTMLKIICNMEDCDSGRIDMPKGYRIGYLDQHIHFTKSSVLEEACTSLSEEEQYDFYKAETILFGLGFTEEDMSKDPTSFSGGYQLRINLTKTLLKNPDMLLLDEPTNYLDIVSLRWLRRFLNNFRGEAIIITHDRDFMDSVITHTMGIQRGTLLKIPGNTEKYYTQISVNEEIHEKTREKQEKRIEEMKKFAKRFGAKASKASQAQSKMKQAEKIEKSLLGKLSMEYKPGFRFNYKATSAKVLMEVSDLSFAFEGQEQLFKDLFLTVKSEDRIGIIGKNGKGKTTLLNVLSGQLKETKGEIKLHNTAEIGFYEQTNRKDLKPDNTIAEEIYNSNPALTNSQARSICGAMMFSGDVADKKISVLSGGEQSRVLFGKVIAHPANMLLLDEPSNHLDMESIEVMIDEIDKFKGSVMIVTHNEELLHAVANKLIVFQGGEAFLFLGTYAEFLDKIGWAEEEDVKEKKEKKEKPQSSNKHEEKKRKKELRKLNKEYEALEKEIVEIEETLKQKNKEALNEYNQKDALDIQNLYKEIAVLQSTLDANYEKIDKLAGSISTLEQE